LELNFRGLFSPALKEYDDNPTPYTTVKIPARGRRNIRKG